MIKPQHLKRGDTVAIVSTASGILGEPAMRHKLDIARSRLEKDFGLKVKVMPNALKGIDYLSKHPEARAKDFMDAIKDPSIKGIINATGGEDTIRLLPYLDIKAIKENPKVFCGFSDTTVLHFAMQKADVMSYYGAALMQNFAEYVKINDYTRAAIENTLFHPQKTLEIKNAGIESFKKDIVWWSEENQNTQRKMYKDELGYEVLQGRGKASGRLIGGCVDVFLALLGTPLFPRKNAFKGKILMMDICDVEGDYLVQLMRNFAASGILAQLKGILIGKPQEKERFDEYKNAILRVLREEGLTSIPVIFNVNFGHAEPIGVFPLGAMCELDCDQKKITLLESATK